jgi:hypothetical protein
MSRVTSSSSSTQQQTQQGTKSGVPHEKIAMRAYEKWCQRGRPQGTHVQDWLDAERELSGEAGKTPPAPQRR